MCISVHDLHVGFDYLEHVKRPHTMRSQRYWTSELLLVPDSHRLEVGNRPAIGNDRQSGDVEHPVFWNDHEPCLARRIERDERECVSKRHATVVGAGNADDRGAPSSGVALEEVV